MNAALTLLRDRVTNAWPMVKRVLVGAVVIVVVALLINLGRKLEWAQVWHAAKAIDNGVLVLAGALVVLGYLTYASFDLLARHYAKHSVAAWKVVGMAMVSYAINLNLGVLVGSIGARLRLYFQLGVKRSTAVQVVLFSTVTNWLGYAWLAGALFLAGLVPVPQGWNIGGSMLQGIGAVMIGVAGAYVIFCGVSNRRTWTLRGRRIELPSLKLALAQSGLAMLSWLLMASIIYVLLERQVGYGEVLAILLFCSVAALITHIPGGLGVTEAIYVAALSGRLPQDKVLAAVLMYRLLYALGPLCLALIAYIAIEASHTRHSKREIPASKA